MSFFEKLTDGLRLYEVILLLLGAVMFLALVAMMIVYASQRRTLKPLFMFFAIPVLMLVWPSVQKIKIDGQGAEIEKQVAAVEKNPTDENKKELEETVAALEDRNVKDPEVVKKIIKAHYLLGDSKAAKDAIQTLPASETADPEVKNIRTSIIVTDKLQEQLQVVNQNPADSNKIKELNQLKIEASQLEVKNEELKTDIKVADQKVTNYQKDNPRVRIRSQLLTQ